MGMQFSAKMLFIFFLSVSFNFNLNQAHSFESPSDKPNNGEDSGGGGKRSKKTNSKVIKSTSDSELELFIYLPDQQTWISLTSNGVCIDQKENNTFTVHNSYLNCVNNSCSMENEQFDLTEIISGSLCNQTSKTSFNCKTREKFHYQFETKKSHIFKSSTEELEFKKCGAA